MSLTRSLRQSLVAALVFVSSPAFAASISSVGYVQTSTEVGESVSLHGTLLYESTGFELLFTVMFTPVLPISNSFVVNLLVSSPAPDEEIFAIVASENFEIELAVNYPPGDYSYELNLYTGPRELLLPVNPYELPKATLTDTRTGTFSVVPEPSQSVLVALALSVGLGISRKRPSARAS